MSMLARRWRVAAVTVGLAVLLIGSIVGSDDDFPFGPFRMFAGYAPPTEVVHDTRVTAVTATGRTITVSAADSGYRRAELEGELAQFEAHPAELRDIAVSYHRREPGRPPLVTVRVVDRQWHIVNRDVRGYTDVTLAYWSSQ